MTSTQHCSPQTLASQTSASHTSTPHTSTPHTSAPHTAAPQTSPPQTSIEHSLALNGVDHSARPTWKLRETVRFYRDVLGLPLIHAISARGWGTDTHPDFLHFFFDSGRGSAIAFFYYIGTQPPADLAQRAGKRPAPDDHVFDATHVAWQVETVEELEAWRARLEAQGVEVSPNARHEVIESIYFRDPNGYFLEITLKLRPLVAADAADAALTLEAAMQLEGEPDSLRTIDDVWRRKARLHRVAEAA